MKFKSEEFEIGRRHLARMMGENPDNFTQQDIDVFKFKNILFFNINKNNNKINE